MPLSPSLPTTSPTTWPLRLWRRCVVLWPVKALGTMGFMALFFWAYFTVLRQPLREAFVMPATWLDDWIAFTPAAFPVYAALWLYVSLPPAFLGGLRSLLCFGVWITALCLFCLGVFWLWPTAVPAASIDWAAYPDLALIKSVDNGGNACPSLHVASSVFSALWLERIARSVGAPRWLRATSAFCCLAIV